jgi:probable rRNA maturation factor
MILLDPDLDPNPRPNGNRLAELPIRRGANSAPRSGPGAPKTNWRRAALPWAERLPTPATLNRFLREAQTALRLPGQVSVLLATDAAVRKLNRQFRGKNKATDVLSFPAEPIPGIKRSEQPAGDLAISVDTARKQAAQQGHALTCELKILMLHGLLHLAGYDHETDDGKMARREGLLRARFGLPLGLIERAEGGEPAQSRSAGVAPVSRSAVRRASRPSAEAANTPILVPRNGIDEFGPCEQSGPKLSTTARASQREASNLAQGEVRRRGRNPGKAPAPRPRRPVGPARKSAPNHRSPRP